MGIPTPASPPLRILQKAQQTRDTRDPRPTPELSARASETDTSMASALGPSSPEGTLPQNVMQTKLLLHTASFSESKDRPGRPSPATPGHPGAPHSPAAQAAASPVNLRLLCGHESGSDESPVPGPAPTGGRHEPHLLRSPLTGSGGQAQQRMEAYPAAHGSGEARQATQERKRPPQKKPNGGRISPGPGRSGAASVQPLLSAV